MATTDLDGLLELENSPEIDTIISKIRVRVQEKVPEKPAAAMPAKAEPPPTPIEDALKAQASFNGELMSVLQELGKECVSLRAELAQVRQQQQATAEQDRKTQDELASSRLVYSSVEQAQAHLKQQLAELMQVQTTQKEASVKQGHELARQKEQVDTRVHEIDARILATIRQIDGVARRTHEIGRDVEQLGHRVDTVFSTSANLETRVTQADKRTRQLETHVDQVRKTIEHKLDERLVDHAKASREELDGIRTAVDGAVAWTNVELDTARTSFHSSLEGVQRQLAELESIRGLVQQDYVYLSDRTGTLEQKATELAALVSGSEAQVARRFDALTMRVLRAERGLANRPALPASSGIPSLSGAKSNGNGSSRHPARPFDYFMFEHKYRGSVDSVRQRQATYVSLFSGRRHIVDLGCGRGEFLDLMSKNGVCAKGVDVDRDMVDFCRERGLDVIQADLFEYLSSLPSADIDGIFAAQVIEHMPPDKIQMLIELCEKKLKPDGLFVLETVNPLCLRALSNFWLDPTHVRPVPPHLLTFMLQQGNFSVTSVRFASPIDNRATEKCFETVEGLADVEGYQDYAVVASRTCCNAMRGDG